MSDETGNPADSDAAGGPRVGRFERLRRLRSDGLARESSWSLAYEVSTLLGTLVSFMLLGRTLGADGYGAYASLYAIVSPMVTLAASGLTLSLLQHAVQDREPLAATARSCLSLALLIGLLLTVTGTGIATTIVGELSLIEVVSLLATEFLVTPAVHLAAATAQIAADFAAASKIRLMFVFMRTAVITLLALTGRLTIASLGLTTLAVGGAMSIVVLHRVGKEFHFKLRPGSIRWTHLKSNAIYSTAISASALGNDGDKIVLAANKLVVDVGLYSVAYRVVQFGMLPVGSVVNAGHVRFLAHTDGVRRQHLDRAIRFASAASLYGVVCAAALFLAAPLVPIVFGSDFEGSVQMVRWLAPVLIVRSLTIFAGNGLMGLGRHSTRTMLSLVNAAVSMAIYVTLIPQFGWKGAAVGTLIAESLDCISGWTALVIFQRRADNVLVPSEERDLGLIARP